LRASIVAVMLLHRLIDDLREREVR
jgi:hypothetical protein